MNIFEKITSDSYSTHNRSGPWNRAAEVSAEDVNNAVEIVEWCKQNLESNDWAYQFRNWFATNDVIFYFNNDRDYTFFMLKYKL
jgi:hypothetical protein